MSQNGNPNSHHLTARDALAFVLVGDWEGEAYEGLDDDQLARMQELLNILAEHRLTASIDIPTISESSRRMQAGNN